MARHEVTQLSIGGMRDNNCRERLIEALERMPGVFEATVSLHRSTATIIHEAGCDRADLIATVERTGFGVFG